jgi:xylan 1,4-beta-xylosidase
MTHIQLHPDDRTTSLRRPWDFGFNTCHAPIVMRSDLQAQMLRAHEELGHRYWRCHGTLSDDVGILVQGPDGKLHYHFSGLTRILDAGLRSGVKPFLELSFMPAAIARDPTQTITHYQGITSAPADFSQWKKLVYETVSFLSRHYGKSELRKWYFEVWNEPNIPFWIGTQQEYFELYRRAALAIKKVDSRFRVGGPATARGEWITDFLQFTKSTATPVDFISTHIYPSDVAFSDSAEGKVKLKGLDYLQIHFRRVENEVKALYPKLPIVWGEWNSSAGPLATNHDTCNNAALVTGALALMSEHADGSLYWGLSDIYEECNYHFAPFHGDYGLYTVDGIAKSAARAIELMGRLQSRKLSCSSDLSGCAQGFLATMDEAARNVSILLWNHDEKLAFDSNGNPIALTSRSRSAKPAPWKVAITPGSLRPKKGALTRILPGKGSAYETWLQQGSPLNLTRGQLKALQRASVPEVRPLAISGRSSFSISVPVGSIALLEFECKS